MYSAAQDCVESNDEWKYNYILTNSKFQFSISALLCSPPFGLIVNILCTIFSTTPRFFFLNVEPLGPRKAAMRLFPSHLRSAHFFMIWRTWEKTCHIIMSHKPRFLICYNWNCF